MSDWSHAGRLRRQGSSRTCPTNRRLILSPLKILRCTGRVPTEIRAEAGAGEGLNDDGERPRDRADRDRLPLADVLTVDLASKRSAAFQGEPREVVAGDDLAT